MRSFPFISLLRKSRSEVSKKVFRLRQRAFVRGAPRKEGSGGTLWEARNGLSASATSEIPTSSDEAGRDNVVNRVSLPSPWGWLGQRIARCYYLGKAGPILRAVCATDGRTAPEFVHGICKLLLA